MIKKLLVVVATGALICMACFTVLGFLGGFPPSFGPQGWGTDGPPWVDGGWRGNGRDPGPEVTRNLPYTGIDRLDIGYPAEITVTQGSEARFTVTGPQYVLDQIRLEDGSVIWDGWGRRGWGRRFRGRLRIDIVSPTLHEFQLSGAQQLHLRNFDQDSLSLHVSGTADIEGAGKARRLDAHISGAGHLRLDQLVVEDAELHISGAGDASLDARRSSEVHVSGVAHVRLRCRPLNVDVQKSGPADIEYGPDCSTLPPPTASSVAPATPASPVTPPAPAAPAAPAPKTKI